MPHTAQVHVLHAPHLPLPVRGPITENVVVVATAVAPALAGVARVPTGIVPALVPALGDTALGPAPGPTPVNVDVQDPDHITDAFQNVREAEEGKILLF